MTGFPIIKIGELIKSGEAEIQTGPFGTQLKASDYSDQGHPVINVRNVGFGDIRAESLEFIDDRIAEKLPTHRLMRSDIVFGRKGAVERHGFITERQEGWYQGSDCLRLRFKSCRINPQFISYFFRTQAHQDWMMAVCAFGATMASLNQDIVKLIDIPVPDIKIQNRIVGLLSAYDDLIENSKRRITLLEKMAEEIYREWFVRFRFPGWQGAEFEKGLPASWAVVKGDDLFGVVKGKSYSSEEISNHQNGGRPFINLKNFNRGGGYRSNGLKYFRGEFRDDQRVNRGDVVMAVTDMTQNREVIGRAARVPYLGESDGVISLDVVKISAFEWPGIFTYAHLRYSGISEALKELANGANVLHLKPDLVGKQQYLVPDALVVENFVGLIKPFYEQMEKLERQIEVLERTKAQLLPRLISGKVSVENLDIQFPPSMQNDKTESPVEAVA